MNNDDKDFINLVNSKSSFPRDAFIIPESNKIANLSIKGIIAETHLGDMKLAGPIKTISLYTICNKKRVLIAASCDAFDDYKTFQGRIVKKIEQYQKLYNISKIEWINLENISKFITKSYKGIEVVYSRREIDIGYEEITKSLFYLKYRGNEILKLSKDVSHHSNFRFMIGDKHSFGVGTGGYLDTKTGMYNITGKSESFVFIDIDTRASLPINKIREKHERG